jgi:hypothetical protein
LSIQPLNCRLLMIKNLGKLVILFLLATLALLTPLAVVADEELISEDEDQQKADQLRKEVEAILAETDDQESERLLVKRAFCGNLVTHKEDISELIVDVRDEEKVGQYDEETVMIGINRESIKPQDLETGSYVVAMGYLNRSNPDKLQIKRLVIQETPTPLVKESFFGQVGDISSEEKVFILNQEESVYEVLASEAALSYQDDEGDIISGKFDRLEEKDKVVVVGQRENDNGRVEASKIYIFTAKTGDS